MADARNFEEMDVEGEACEVGKLLKSSLKAKDALLKALKVFHWTSCAGVIVNTIACSASMLSLQGICSHILLLALGFNCHSPKDGLVFCHQATLFHCE